MKFLILILSIFFTASVALANDVNEDDVNESDALESSTIDPGSSNEVISDSFVESIPNADQLEDESSVEPDSSINTFSKYNFLFYFIYKYKYDGSVEEYEEVQDIVTN